MTRLLGLWIVTTAIAGACSAQEDPFGVVPRPAGEAAPAARPPAPSETAQPDPLAIQLLRASKPQTPRELIQAAQSAFQFGRPDESKRYLAALAAAKPADDALAPLTAAYGELLLTLTQAKELQPEGKQVAEMIYSAAQRFTQDSERIAAAIAQLSDPRPAFREEALTRLADAGTSIVNPLLQALADAGRNAEHTNIRTALAVLGRVTELPLIAALEANNTDLKAQLISVLARMGSRRALPLYIRYAVDPASPGTLREISTAALLRVSGARPDLHEVKKFLERQIERIDSGDVPLEFDEDDRATLWQWDEGDQKVVAVKIPRRESALLMAAHHASDIFSLAPADSSAQRRMLLLNLELAKMLAGIGQSLPAGPGTVHSAALAAGPQRLNEVLADALRQHRTGAAVAAAELLAEINNPQVLHSGGGMLSPLAQAITSSDRRVRLAAALAAFRLTAGAPFPGAGQMADVLAWFIETSGNDNVLIGHPRGEDAQSLVGFVNALGYAGEGVYTGRALAERAFHDPDCPFVLVADSIDQPPVEELVQWLRRDYRTARQPIGIMARGERLQTLENAFRDDAFAIVFPRLYSVEVTAVELDRLKAIAGRNLVPAEERLAQAQQALSALFILANHPKARLQYDLLRHEPTFIRALNQPVLARQAAAILGVFGTPKAQTALVEFASQTSRPTELRQAAAEAFANAVGSRGLRLTNQQQAIQHARHRSAAAARDAGHAVDEASLAIQTSILKAMEGSRPSEHPAD